MKCPADIVLGCDEQIECICGFCFEHCICEYLEINDYNEWYYDEKMKL